MVKKKVAKKKAKPKTKAKPKKKAIKKAVKPAEATGSDPKLIAGCRLWDRATTKAKEGNYPMPALLARFKGWDSSRGVPLYSEGDYNALKCRIQGKLAELTVGSSEGHKTKIDLDKKKLQYFDWFEPRIKVMKKLFASIGMKCSMMSSPRGLNCTVTPAKLENAFKVLAMPTSMDFRWNYCKQEHYETQCEAAEQKYFDDGPRRET